jgi:hypothetical protein
MLVPKFADSNPAEAMEFFGRKKIFSMPSFGGEVKPSVPCRSFAACRRPLQWSGSRIVRLNLTDHFSPIIFLSLIEVSHAVWCGAPLDMNGGTKTGLSTISLGRLQCVRRVSADPTERRRRWRRRRRKIHYGVKTEWYLAYRYECSTFEGWSSWAPCSSIYFNCLNIGPVRK